MIEEQTFSGIVDEIVHESNRVQEKLTSIPRFVNDTIAELQQSQLFAEDMYEEIIDAPVTATDSGQQVVWEKPLRWRKMQAVKYSNYLGNTVYPKCCRPSAGQESMDDFYYASGNAIVIAGKYGMTAPVIAYYKTSPMLKYYEPEQRPAKCDSSNGQWSYLLGGVYVQSLATPEEEELARAKVSNWLIQRYGNVLVNGALAKLYKMIGDTRNSLAYSQFMSSKQDVLNNEIYAGSTS